MATADHRKQAEDWLLDAKAAHANPDLIALTHAVLHLGQVLAGETPTPVLEEPLRDRLAAYIDDKVRLADAVASCDDRDFLNALTSDLDRILQETA